MTYRAWELKNLDRAALRELTAAIAEQAAEELEYNAQEGEPWSEQKYKAVLAAQQKENALLAGVLAPLFDPLGFGDWRVVTALISGFMAKESVVSTIALLFGSTAALTAAITPLAALCLLVFCLLYTPCVAAIASVKRELGGTWALGMVVAQCAIAWVVALVFHVVGALLGF